MGLLSKLKSRFAPREIKKSAALIRSDHRVRSAKKAYFINMILGLSEKPFCATSNGSFCLAFTILPPTALPFFVMLCFLIKK
jgi:hypothetical protein